MTRETISTSPENNDFISEDLPVPPAIANHSQNPSVNHNPTLLDSKVFLDN